MGIHSPPYDVSEHVFLVRCAWCDRMKTRKGWMLVPDVDNSNPVSHGICPQCFKRLRSRGSSV
jgi:hypothetical protein